MIDHNRTFVEFGYNPDDLSRGSAKKVVVVCIGCGEVRDVEYKSYRDICHPCAMKKKHLDDPTIGSRQGTSLRQKHIDDPTLSQRLSDAQTKRFESQEACDEMSEIKKQWYIDHPEARELAKLKADEQWESQGTCDEQSERITNSAAMKIEHERQIGGYDIVNHHYLYDHTNLKLNTVQMTRSDHTRLHHLLNRLGFKVPHININQMEVL